MGLRDIESTLPPGFRFHPSDGELVCHYLYRKVANLKGYEGTMIEVDLHIHEPWELPEGAKLSDDEWYFFSFRDRKYATGSRTNRATKSGYWKATGKDRTIHHPETRVICGMRKTLVFYSGRAPNGIKTGWVMHEFRLEIPHTPPKEDWVLCRVFHKRKGETSNNSSLENNIEHDHKLVNGCSSSSHLDSSPPMVDQLMPDGCFEMMGVPHHLNLAVLHYNNFLDFPQEFLDTTSVMGMHQMMGMGSKDGIISSRHDDYGFFFDVGIDDDHANDVHAVGSKGNVSIVEDTRF